MAKIKSPFGAVPIIALTATGAQAVTVENGGKTLIDGVTVSATGSRTINLSIDAEMEVGAEIVVQVKTDGTETTTFGTGITGPVITGVAGKTKNQVFVYNGSAFVATGASVQID